VGNADVKGGAARPCLKRLVIGTRLALVIAVVKGKEDQSIRKHGADCHKETLD
jgi:hypothetical protein